MTTLLKQLCCSLMFFTRLRLPFVSDCGTLPLAGCAWTYPLVGLLVGSVTTGVFVLLSNGWLPAASAAWVAVMAQILFTGALHEDGLADTADGIASHRSPQEKLAIMRDSHIGSFGVLALITVIALRATLIGEIKAYAAACAVIIAAAIMSRTAMALLMFIAPLARADGLAKNAGHPGIYGVFACMVVAAALVTAFCNFNVALTALIVAGVIAWVMKTLAMRHFGGITGDVLGACQQLSEIALLMALSRFL